MMCMNHFAIKREQCFAKANRTLMAYGERYGVFIARLRWSLLRARCRWTVRLVILMGSDLDKDSSVSCRFLSAFRMRWRCARSVTLGGRPLRDLLWTEPESKNFWTTSLQVDHFEWKKLAIWDIFLPSLNASTMRAFVGVSSSVRELFRLTIRSFVWCKKYMFTF